MVNREFVMLSHSLKETDFGKFSLGNWFASEKLDGMRAIWLPDTIGLQISKFPWANLEKDRTGSRNRFSTGLWSRYARPIWAPAWFTEQFPRDQFLDGELWTGRGEFQRLTSIVKQGTPGPEWANVQYRVFDSPSPDAIYRDGKIHNGQLKKQLRGIWQWCKSELAYDYRCHADTFDRCYFQSLMKYSHIQNQNVANILGTPQYLVCHPQEQLTWKHSDAVERLNKLLEETLAAGGEGLIVRAPHSVWEPIRSKLVLKLKPSHDAEGTVIGYSMGEGRLEGMIGSLQIRSTLNGNVVEFGLSGMSDELRAWPSTVFPVGTVVTYRYRETTEDGLPREARFLRVWSDL